MAKTLIDPSAAADQLVTARTQLQRTLGLARRALAPAALAQRASGQAKAAVTAHLKARPYAAGLTATAIVAVMLRQPIAGLTRQLLRKTRHDR